MRVFVTGATGFIGTPVVAQLLAAGHQVLGLTRSEEGARALETAGAAPHRGAIKDLDSLRAGVAATDATIHLAFNHDFSTFAQNCEDDRLAIAAMGEALTGPLLVTSGTAIAPMADDKPAVENGPVVSSDHHPRAKTEEAANALSAAGRDVRIVRLPQVHDPRRQGLITYAISNARETGVVAYVGDGAQRWAAGHVSDVARLYRLALERGAAGARYHAVGEQGVSMKAVAEVLGDRLGLPVKSIPAEQAAAQFGWLAMFAGLDMAASSDWTQEALGWTPTGPTLLEDLAVLALDE
jgi:nucleoside-diphosphate-sugar epimerase